MRRLHSFIFERANEVDVITTFTGKRYLPGAKYLYHGVSVLGIDLPRAPTAYLICKAAREHLEGFVSCGGVKSSRGSNQSEIGRTYA